MMSPSRLAAWLKQVPRAIDYYVIVLLPTDEDPEKEKTIAQYPGYAEAEKDHVQFAETLLAEIQSHCDTINQVSRYEVRALQKNETMTSRIVRCVPKDVDTRDPLRINLGPAEGNNSSQQLVRTIEALLQVNVASFGMIQTAWKEILSTQADQIEALRRRETELANTVLVEISRQNDIEESDINKTRALNKLTDMIEKYVPTILSNLTGEDIPEQ
jgi:hypothetical protein